MNSNQGWVSSPALEVEGFLLLHEFHREVQTGLPCNFQKKGSCYRQIEETYANILKKIRDLELIMDGFSLLIPHVATGKAFRFMHAQHPAALRAGPFILIKNDELIYPEFLNKIQVFDHTRSISASVALIQVFDVCTRKFIAFVTKLKLSGCHFFAVLNLARQTRFHFYGVITSATRAMILNPDIRVAKPAIDSAWGDQHLICQN